MTSASIVVVTGANRGIGFEISRQLANRGAQVVLTARKPEVGKDAVKKLAAQNLTVQFQPLDVTSNKSIIALREFLTLCATSGHSRIWIWQRALICQIMPLWIGSARSYRLKRRSAVTVQAMGYFWVGTSKLDDWSSLAIGQLGLQAVDRGGKMRAFRMDDRKQRLIIDGGLPDGERFFGWEVADAKALGALAARLEKAGVAVRRETTTVADQRCAAEVISFRDPAGNRVEAFHGGQIADEPFCPVRHIGGFRTGTQGMGHAVLVMPEIDAALKFYRDLLGFRITDFMGPPVSLYFMHVNSRHHSLAIAQGSSNRMHHLMMEFYSLDDVGQSYDIAQQEDRVVVKFGRHPNDFMTSFYMRTPSQFLIEHGWGGREVTPGWQPAELKSAGSFWGHQGLFESLGEPPTPDAPPPPPMPAPEPNHAPLQVIDGNYERMSGVCPWWDAVKRGSRPI